MRFKSMLTAAGLSGALLTGGVMVAHEEGEMLSSYVDPVGIVTACFGKTGPDIRLGQSYSSEQCLQMLADDLDVYNRQLLRLTDGVSLTESEHAAYLSFIYNIGAEAFRTSTLRGKLQAGDRTGACRELERWVYAKGVVLPGLVARRDREMQLCLKEIVNAEQDNGTEGAGASIPDRRADYGFGGDGHSAQIIGFPQRYIGGRAGDCCSQTVHSAGQCGHIEQPAVDARAREAGIKLAA